MRRLFTLLAALVVTLTLRGQEDPTTLLGAGDRLPHFEVAMTDGSHIRSSELEGKVVWITLWASWCPSCRKEFKWLSRSEAFEALTAHPDVLFLPIAREENSATVAAWLRKKGYSYRSGVDPTREIYSLFATEEIPRNLLVAPDGTIVSHTSTYSPKALEELVATANEMLNSK